MKKFEVLSNKILLFFWLIFALINASSALVTFVIFGITFETAIFFALTGVSLGLASYYNTLYEIEKLKKEVNAK